MSITTSTVIIKNTETGVTETSKVYTPETVADLAQLLGMSMEELAEAQERHEMGH